MDTEKLLGEALQLLTDYVLVEDKNSPPLQRRVSEFLDQISTEDQIRLLRKGQK